MEQLPSLGTAIGEVVGPTFGIYASLITQNAANIRSVTKETHSYGATERQKLDIYAPPNASIVNGRKAVLIFIYGGGFVHGSKTLSGFADDLVYANLASFFALQYGYTVVVPDYRLVQTHSGARYPSGGEDVASVVDWISNHFKSELVDLYMMGNSAGGVHLSTFMLDPCFASSRSNVISGETTRLKGIILLSVPFHFHNAHPERSDALSAYYGHKDAHLEQCPTGLLRSARKSGPIDFVEGGVRVLVLNGDLDPEDEILGPRDDFLKEWAIIGTPESRSALAVDFMKGHNHISPVCGLGTGIEREEAWGIQVASFCETLRKFEA